MANLITRIAPSSVTVEGTAMQRFGAFVPEAAKPYGELSSSHADFAALTEAAFHLAGLVRRSSEKAAPEAVRDGKGGGLAFWKLIVGPSAYGNWGKLGRIDADGITVKGLNELSSRTDPAVANGYSTTAERITLIAAVLAKGGPLKLEKGGKVVKFGAPVGLTVKAPQAAAKAPQAASKATAKATATAAPKPTRKGRSAAPAKAKGHVMITPKAKV